MSEPRGPRHPSPEERIVEAAREEIAEAREEFAEVAREAIDEARELVLEVAAAAVAGSASAADGGIAVSGAGGALPLSGYGATDPISQIVQREVNALAGRLSPYQLAVLADLIRLHLSLRGPQRLLDNTGNFNRPIFPSPPQTIGQ